MIFRPRTVALMWDTWLYYHQEKHYLFYLHQTRGDRWDGIGLAVSDDGVHFDDRGPIIHKADDAMWLGTGMVWRAGDRFMLNFSEERNGVQEIFFAESDDLLRWRRLPDEEFVCRADPRWYADASDYASQRWDCIWVLPRDDGPGYIGFLTAVAREGPPGLRGTAGCVSSDDGRHFRAAPPAIEPGFWGDRIEIGAVERIGDRWYMLVADGSMGLGSRHMSRLLAGEPGMYVLMSETQAGPYRLDPRQPPLLVSSPDLFTYFARFYRCGDEMLLNHHTVPRGWSAFSGGNTVSLSPLKSIRVEPMGVLGLHWWHGNEALKGTPRPARLEDFIRFGLNEEECSAEAGRLRLTAASGGLAVLPAQYDTARGVVLEAELTLEPRSGPLGGAGLFIEGQPRNTGTLLLAQRDGYLAVGAYNGYRFVPDDAKPTALSPGQPTRWRLLVREAVLELYVDDALIECYTMRHDAHGRLGFVVEASTATVANVAVWEMSL